MRIVRFIESLINDPIIADKMIFIAGPRQVGKTNTAKAWLAEAANDELYFNWDDEKVRRAFRKDPRFFESVAREFLKHPRIVFDEMHKINKWKNILKGYFDTLGTEFRFLITGSARLEMLQSSGEGMVSRYHLLHLNPLVPNEVENQQIQPNTKLIINEDVLSAKPIEDDVINNMLGFTGFPEPFLKQSARFSKLWRKEYQQRLLKDDLRDLSRITDINRAEHLMELLPIKIGSPLSLNNLRQDLDCSHDAVKSLVASFERLYLLTSIRPYSKRVRYSITKEPKLYFTDWTVIDNEGVQFENFIAIQLKTFCDYVTDGGWCSMNLYYLRDKQHREVDFLLTKDDKPALLIESKLLQTEMDKNLLYFSQMLGNLPAIQVVRQSKVFKKVDTHKWIVSVNRFMNLLWTA